MPLDIKISQGTKENLRMLWKAKTKEVITKVQFDGRLYLFPIGVLISYHILSNNNNIKPKLLFS